MPRKKQKAKTPITSPLSFIKNLFGLDPDVEEGPLRTIYRTEIQDSVIQQYDDARTAFFQMCVHEGAQLGALKLNRLQIDLQRRGKVETVFNDDNANRSRASIAVESFIHSNKDRERRDGNHLDNEYNKRLSHFSTYTPEDLSKGLSLTDTYIQLRSVPSNPLHRVPDQPAARVMTRWIPHGAAAPPIQSIPAIPKVASKANQTSKKDNRPIKTRDQ